MSAPSEASRQPRRAGRRLKLRWELVTRRPKRSRRALVLERIRSLARDRRGVFAVEVALMAPVLIVGALGVMDLGYALIEDGRLEFAVMGSARANDAGWGGGLPGAAVVADGPGCFKGTKSSNLVAMFPAIELTARACFPVSP